MGARRALVHCCPSWRARQCENGEAIRVTEAKAATTATARARERVRVARTRMQWLRSDWCGGAKVLRGCTLRRACASVSKWRASERASCAVPRRKKMFKKTNKSRRSPREACALARQAEAAANRRLPRPCRMIGVKVTVAAGRLRRIWRWWRRWRLRKVVSNLTAARRSAGEVAADHTGWCE